jgi:hypothetical protein
MGNSNDAPHEKRHGWLRNGNPPGDYTSAPRCGAKNRASLPCKAPAMKNGRCRLHGGKSTGPRTVDGLERSRRARLKHGERSTEVRSLITAMRKLLENKNEN